MTDAFRLLESRRSRLSRWAGAAALVCVLHVGGAALALLYSQADDAAEDTGGVMTMELAPLPAVARVDSADVAHGPDQQQAKLTQEASRQALEEVRDIPPVERSPAPEPVVALPKPRPTKEERPEEEAREEAPEKEVRQQDEEVPLTTAPPRVDAQPAPSAARSKELSTSDALAIASWQDALSRQLSRHKRVPKGALGQRGRWEAIVAFTVDRAGRVVSAELKQGTGVPALDQEALEWLQRASPFPPPPDIPDLELHFTQSIEFGVK